jgi:AcrR family transcriptional regulator
MAEPVGRREANKQATRIALRSAAKQLFASQGYERTTVRDIAQLANVTERTFYRYFDGKEDLVADEFRTWLEMVKEAIISRPPEEPALLAVRRALLSVASQATTSGAPGPLWLVSASPPAARLWRATARPLLRVEETIASALLARPGANPILAGPDEAPAGLHADSDSAGPDYDFEAHVLARICVAALRSAIIELRGKLRASEAVPEAAGAASDFENLLSRAFAIVTAAALELSRDAAP